MNKKINTQATDLRCNGDIFRERVTPKEQRLGTLVMLLNATVNQRESQNRNAPAGISSCLQIIYSRDLVNEIHQDADTEPETPPSIGKSDSANLYRLSLAAATLLRDVSEEHIARLNRFGDE